MTVWALFERSAERRGAQRAVSSAFHVASGMGVIAHVPTGRFPFWSARAEIEEEVMAMRVLAWDAFLRVLLLNEMAPGSRYGRRARNRTRNGACVGREREIGMHQELHCTGSGQVSVVFLLSPSQRSSIELLAWPETDPQWLRIIDGPPLFLAC